MAFGMLDEEFYVIHVQMRNIIPSELAKEFRVFAGRRIDAMPFTNHQAGRLCELILKSNTMRCLRIDGKLIRLLEQPEVEGYLCEVEDDTGGSKLVWLERAIFQTIMEPRLQESNPGGDEQKVSPDVFNLIESIPCLKKGKTIRRKDIPERIVFLNKICDTISSKVDNSRTNVFIKERVQIMTVENGVCVPFNPTVDDLLAEWICAGDVYISQED